jgi:S1-C subfamily serine protease
MQDAPRSGSRLDRVLVIAVFVFQALAALAFLAMPLLAIGYFNTPFLGAFFDNTMVSNGVAPTPIPAHWDLMQQGVGYGDQLVMLDGQPVTNAQQMQAILQKHFPGETIPAVFNMGIGGEPPNAGDRQEFQVTLSIFNMKVY